MEFNRAAAAHSRLLLVLALQFFVPFLLCRSTPLSDDASALAAFKRAIFEDPHSVLSDWSIDLEDGDPCGWRGVGCSSPASPPAQRRVISLSLSNSSLKGFIAPELGQLSALQELILGNNFHLGTIPKQIGMLKSLRVLDLSSNRLTGVIPAELGDLSSINKIYLQSNGLTGSIPPELGNLESLVELRLDRNQLRGSIPGNASVTTSSISSANNGGGTGLCPSPRLTVGDFSYNFLTGRIPPCLKYLPRSSFQENCFQDEYSTLQRALALCKGGSATPASPRQHKPDSWRHKHHGFQQPRWLLVLEIVTGVLVLLFVVSVAFTALRSCRMKPSVKISSFSRSRRWSDEIAVSIETDADVLKNVHKLSRQELEVACEDFSNIIGSSQESVLYKGTAKNGSEIAVVSLCSSEQNWSSHHELFFQNKISELAKLDHENIAKFLGYCKEAEPFSRMLVFEYASNGTLYEHLHYGEESTLSWLRRMRIAVGIARGLKYLHTEREPPFAIADLKSSTVYITDDFTPKLADFDCCKMMYKKHGKRGGFVPDTGSRGYRGPLERGHAGVQGNTFAFGVILLEIITGRPAYCKERGYLVDWALKYLPQPEEIGKLVDPEVASARADDLAVICSVVSLCIDPEPSKRPSMQIIAGVLENGIDLSAAAVLKDSPLAWAELALSA